MIYYYLPVLAAHKPDYHVDPLDDDDDTADHPHRHDAAAVAVAGGDAAHPQTPASCARPPAEQVLANSNG